MIRLFRLSALALILASPTMPGAIQTAALAQSEQRPGPNFTVQQQPAPQAQVWSRSAAEELLAYVEGIGQEGLDPAAYGPERLRAEIASGREALWTPVATQIFMRLAADLSGGYVRGNGRVDWHIAGNEINGHDQQRLLGEAMRGGGVARVLDGLLPTHPQYAGLKRALAATPESDQAKRDLIRANLERWRWMPRNLGDRHIIVNVPAFTAAVVEDGRVIARHRTIVGARRTPTPQLMSNAVAVTFNPWWNVPQSIIPELGSMRGYQVRRDGSTLIVRQPPGPRNALGRVKIEMPNDHAIYLHDTPAQALFSRPVRAFSHGCIRTQNVRDLAALLLAPTGQWDRSAIDRTIAAGETVSASLTQPVPVYIAYFTAAATTDGNIVTYADIYGRDAPVRQALNRTGSGNAQASLAD